MEQISVNIFQKWDTVTTYRNISIIYIKYHVNITKYGLFKLMDKEYLANQEIWINFDHCTAQCHAAYLNDLQKL